MLLHNHLDPLFDTGKLGHSYLMDCNKLKNELESTWPSGADKQSLSKDILSVFFSAAGRRVIISVMLSKVKPSSFWTRMGTNSFSSQNLLTGGKMRWVWTFSQHQLSFSPFKSCALSQQNLSIAICKIRENKLFLCRLVRNCKWLLHDPWSISWVTNTLVSEEPSTFWRQAISPFIFGWNFRCRNRRGRNWRDLHQPSDDQIIVSGDTVCLLHSRNAQSPFGFAGDSLILWRLFLFS